MAGQPTTARLAAVAPSIRAPFTTPPTRAQPPTGSQRGSSAEAQGARRATPSPVMPMPAPIKPRVRLKAAGAKVPEAATPTELAQAGEKAPGTEETQPKKPSAREQLEPYDRAAYQKLPRISTQEEVDKLPAGTHFIN